MVCKTKTLPILAPLGELYSAQSQRFCRVSYIGFTLMPASVVTHETWPSLKRLPRLKGGLEIGPANE